MLTLKAPAKVNWFLHVLGKRPDGYHNLVSLIQGISMYDELSFTPCGNDSPYGGDKPEDTVEISDDLNIPIEKNLVFKAVKALNEHTGKRRGINITLKKSIPIEAGLGGGSSDAATTLIGLNRLWECGLSAGELAQIGATIGSDVPFFVYSPCALVQGRGEIVTPIHVCAEIPMVIVKPAFSISTAWAYGQLSGTGDYSGKPADNPADNPVNRPVNRPANAEVAASEFIGALMAKDFKKASQYVKNDIGNAIGDKFPEIGEIEKTLTREGAWATLLCGSGSAVYGAFSDFGEAGEARERVAGKMPGHKCRTVHTLT